MTVNLERILRPDHTAYTLTLTELADAEHEVDEAAAEAAEPQTADR